MNLQAYFASILLKLGLPNRGSRRTSDGLWTIKGPRCLCRYSDSLRARRSGNRIPVGVRFSAPIQTGSGAHPASYTMGTGSFPGVKRPGRGV